MGAVLNAANHHIRLAKVGLGVTRRVGQRHEHLALTPTGCENVVLHDRDAALELVLVTKAFKNPLRRMALLLRTLCIFLKDLVDDADKRIKLRPLRRLRAAIPRRFREAQHLIDRSAVNAKNSRRLTTAHPLNLYRVTNTTVQFH